MYKFRNKNKKELFFSQEEMDVYVPYIEVKGIKSRDVSTISIPSDEEADEGYYLVEYNGYILKD